MLQVDKRGRFITNMDFANVVTAAVDSADPRIKGSCMVILEETDPGHVRSRRAHQEARAPALLHARSGLQSAACPPAALSAATPSRTASSFPTISHSEIIEAVFRRTRVTVGLMTSAKLLSAVEPIIRYQRSRFRGGEAARPGTPRYDLGLQTKEDVLHRLVDIWATGEASASLGFAAARLFDVLDPLEKEKDGFLAAEQGLTGRARLQGAGQDLTRRHSNGSRFSAKPDGPSRQRAVCRAGPAIRWCNIVILDALANVLCPACKLWNTGHGATMMREAVSLMGGYGVTEDCPGFLAQKWMDAQLEATYEGPEAVQRRQLSITMTNELFLAQFNAVDSGDARASRPQQPGNRGLHPGHSHAALALDAQSPAESHRRRRGETLSIRAARA